MNFKSVIINYFIDPYFKKLNRDNDDRSEKRFRISRSLAIAIAFITLTLSEVTSQLSLIPYVLIFVAIDYLLVCVINMILSPFLKK